MKPTGKSKFWDFIPSRLVKIASQKVNTDIINNDFIKISLRIYQIGRL